MASLHCSTCEIDWPVDYEEFQECPECRHRCWWRCAGMPKMSWSEAVSIRRHNDFELFYAEWTKRRFSEQAEALSGLEEAIKADA